MAGKIQAQTRPPTGAGVLGKSTRNGKHYFPRGLAKGRPGSGPPGLIASGLDSIFRSLAVLPKGSLVLASDRDGTPCRNQVPSERRFERTQAVDQSRAARRLVDQP